MFFSFTFSHCRRIGSVTDSSFIDVHFGPFRISHTPKAIAAVITTTAIPITMFFLFILFIYIYIYYLHRKHTCAACAMFRELFLILLCSIKNAATNRPFQSLHRPAALLRHSGQFVGDVEHREKQSAEESPQVESLVALERKKNRVGRQDHKNDRAHSNAAGNGSGNCRRC